MTFHIQANELRAILLFAGTDDTRLALTGVLFDATTSRLLLVATDGRMMAVLSTGHCDGNGSFTMSREAIEAALHLLEKNLDCGIVIEKTDGRDLTIRALGRTLIFPGGCIDVPYPNFRAVFPKPDQSRVAQEWIAFDPMRFQTFVDAGELLAGGLDNYLRVSIFGESEEGCFLAIQLSTVPNFFGALMSVRNQEPAVIPPFLGLSL